VSSPGPEPVEHEQNTSHRASSSAGRTVPQTVPVRCELRATGARRAADEPATDTASQGVGGPSCTILRPVGWSVGTGRCHEFTIPPSAPPIVFTLPDGDTATFGATPGGMFGSGQITFLCTNGSLSIVSEFCSPGGGEEPCARGGRDRRPAEIELPRGQSLPVQGSRSARLTCRISGVGPVRIRR
jgi:hypothetical protein